MYSNKAKVSVIVAVFNAPEFFLDRCINSLLQQTLKEIEIILVNDASTSQETADTLDKYSKYDNITIISHSVNKKGGGAWNTGMNAAQGEFIGFVDQDDYVDKRMYQLLYEKAIESDSDIVICSVKRVNNQGAILGVREASENIKKNTVVWDKIYRKSMIKKNNLSCIENTTVADWFTSMCMMYASKISIVNQELYWYVEHKYSSVSNQRFWIAEAMKSENYFFKECKKRGLLKEYADEINFLYFYRYFWNGYKSILKYEIDSLSVLQKMLEFMSSKNISIHDRAIKENLNKKFWKELWILSYYPKLFKVYTSIKYFKYEKSHIVNCDEIND